MKFVIIYKVRLLPEKFSKLTPVVELDEIGYSRIILSSYVFANKAISSISGCIRRINESLKDEALAQV